MRLRIVSEPCHERLSPPAGECELEFMRWVRDLVADDPAVWLAEWVPDGYPFVDPGAGGEPFAYPGAGETAPVPDGSPLFP